MFYVAFSNLEPIFGDQDMQLKFERILATSISNIYNNSRTSNQSPMDQVREAVFLSFRGILRRDESNRLPLENGLKEVESNIDYYFDLVRSNPSAFKLSKDKIFELAELQSRIRSGLSDSHLEPGEGG